MTKKLAVAIYDGLLGFEYGIVAELFGLERPGLGVPWYEFQTCRVERGELRTSHGLIIRPQHKLEDLIDADIVVVPGWRCPHERPKRAFINALCAASDRGARIVSICTGAFALAHAGLLDDRRATTHWLHVDLFRQMFPKVKLNGDALYVQDKRIATSAGSAAGLDLCLAIIRQDFGVKIANTIARRMVAPTHREGGQSQYVEPVMLKADDEDFAPILKWMNSHLEQTFSIEEIANRFSISLRTFHRRFRSLTGLTPHHWLSQQRIVKARGLLETTDLSIEQIASVSGFGSSANLRKHFARHLNTTLRGYRTTFRGVT